MRQLRLSRAVCRGLRCRFCRAGKASSGSVAVEFALIAPILILIFFGTVELARALDCRTRVIDATASAADLIAQGTEINDSGLSAVLNAVDAVIYPYDTDSGQLQIVVSSIKECSSSDTEDSSDACYNKDSGDLVVDWSWASGTRAQQRTSVPSDVSADMFSTEGAGVVMVEVKYAYTSPTVELLTGNITMSSTAYSVPRAIDAVTYSSQ